MQFNHALLCNYKKRNCRPIEKENCVVYGRNSIETGSREEKVNRNHSLDDLFECRNVSFKYKPKKKKETEEDEDTNESYDIQ